METCGEGVGRTNDENTTSRIHLFWPLCSTVAAPADRDLLPLQCLSPEMPLSTWRLVPMSWLPSPVRPRPAWWLCLLNSSLRRRLTARIPSQKCCPCRSRKRHLKSLPYDNSATQTWNLFFPRLPIYTVVQWPNDPSAPWPERCPLLYHFA